MHTHNEVTLLGYYGGDATHALSAWQSTGLELELDLNLLDIEQRIPRLYEETVATKKRSTEELLKFLADNNHCYDEETEVLTPSGWKRFYDLLDTDRVMSVDISTGKGAFELPYSKYSGYYDGDMYYLDLSQVDLAVTSNHRMVVSQKRKADGSDYGKEWEFQLASDLEGKSRKFLKSCQVENQDIFYNKNFAKLVGFFIGEGSYASANTITFNLRKQREIDYLYSLGFPVNKRKSGGYTVYLKDIGESLGHWFKDSCYQDKKKKLPDNYLSYSKQDVENILDGLRNSDGSPHHSNWSFSTNSRVLADQLVTLASLHNFVFTEIKPVIQDIASLGGYGNVLYRLNYSRRISPELSAMKSRFTGSYSKFNYKGQVYCVSVSTGAILVRRNKKICVSGNSTPFEKSAIHFQVTAEIASHIHMLKHRVGISINTESARYRELNEDKAYIPGDWPKELQQDLYLHCVNSFEKYHLTIKQLMEAGLSRKRAKESARFFLPYATQLNFDAMFNFRSFMHFQSLRNSEHAQVEIKDIANNMLTLVKSIPNNPFQYSLKAFGYES